MKSKTPKSIPARNAASLRALDLDLLLRFGAEIADGLHVITGETARREAARLRKEIAALERLAKSSIPVRVDDAATEPAIEPSPNSTSRNNSQRAQPSKLDRATLVSRIEAEVGMVEVWRETDARFCVTVDDETMATSDTLFGAEAEALAWCRGKRVPIAAE
ncbi:MAG: hypothetical protein AAGI03_14030 [Pseudomonadota bacterium]